MPEPPALLAVLEEMGLTAALQKPVSEGTKETAASLVPRAQLPPDAVTAVCLCLPEPSAEWVQLLPLHGLGLCSFCF